MDSPERFLERVASRADFLSFLDALHADYESMQADEADPPASPFRPAARGWENVRLGDFLGAMRAWARDADVEEAPSWRAFAELLLAGKAYE